ncbi:hypothetical protein HO133_005171 [Letharia lupina]|uniref:SprT-like domain-containing protein n=1 Tax=Letharia lupina TaxID=560253 RepID=A0A8H6C9W3_9LECA|nr:uncharacterized protein HO133_005171 [Letharia lupina]KAF6219346.1 hypothetical protein HO133_005171 [Letharia lupina]
MARLNDPLDSDDELPELSTILRPQTDAIIRILAKTPKQEHHKIPSQTKATKNLANEDLLTERHVITPSTFTKVSSTEPQSKKQRPLGHLKQAHVNSLLLPISDAIISNARSEDYRSIEAGDTVSNRASPWRLAKATADHSKLAQASANTSILNHHHDDSSTDLSGFIVPDSASDGEALLPRSLKMKKKKKSRTPKKISTANPQEPGFRESRRPQSNTLQPSGTTALISPEEKNSSGVCLESPPSNGPFGSELLEANPNQDGHLTSSPTEFRSPHESEDKHHPFTPPSSPWKSKLKSPSKRPWMPPSPYRPSIDAFWSQDVVNDWTEQYSPRKIVESPHKFRLPSMDKDEELSPAECPHKVPMKSPAKKDKKVIEQRKLFDEKKHELGTVFLAELDQTITNGQIASMAQPTGGVHIIWSKKLSSTAGRASWRREAIGSKNDDGYVSNTTHRHHASIELAEKVIDDEGQFSPNHTIMNKADIIQDRLINVIAHEYCHLANFMISGVKDSPHGKEFKEWARKCTNAFSHRAINVTTKHSYTIAYKYIWTCMSPTCGLEYKRHSKSIDPSKHSCGNCKGKLVQVQPAPRKGVGAGKRSGYQDFVKQENERVRLENPKAGFGEVMSILGKEFKERKRNEAERASGVRKHSALEKTSSSELECLDFVVRKLDFLNLET